MPTENTHEAAISAAPLFAWPGAKTRLRGLAVAAPIIAVLAVAAWLRPQESGMGTHEQLHMDPCVFLMNRGWPCPTCGMTTSFSAAVHGRIGLAFRAHAFGPVLLAAMTVLLALALAELATGRGFINRLRPRLWWLWVSAGGLLAGWALKAALGYASGAFPVH